MAMTKQKMLSRTMLVLAAFVPLVSAFVQRPLVTRFSPLTPHLPHDRSTFSSLFMALPHQSQNQTSDASINTMFDEPQLEPLPTNDNAPSSQINTLEPSNPQAPYFDTREAEFMPPQQEFLVPLPEEEDNEPILSSSALATMPSSDTLGDEAVQTKSPSSSSSRSSARPQLALALCAMSGYACAAQLGASPQVAVVAGLSLAAYAAVQKVGIDHDSLESTTATSTGAITASSMTPKVDNTAIIAADSNREKDDVESSAPVADCIINEQAKTEELVETKESDLYEQEYQQFIQAYKSVFSYDNNVDKIGIGVESTPIMAMPPVDGILLMPENDDEQNISHYNEVTMDDDKSAASEDSNNVQSMAIGVMNELGSITPQGLPNKEAGDLSDIECAEEELLIPNQNELSLKTEVKDEMPDKFVDKENADEADQEVLLVDSENAVSDLIVSEEKESTVEEEQPAKSISKAKPRNLFFLSFPGEKKRDEAATASFNKEVDEIMATVNDALETVERELERANYSDQQSKRQNKQQKADQIVEQGRRRKTAQSAWTQREAKQAQASSMFQQMMRKEDAEKRQILRQTHQAWAAEIVQNASRKSHAQQQQVEREQKQAQAKEMASNSSRKKLWELIKLGRESNQALASEIVQNAERKKDAESIQVERESNQALASAIVQNAERKSDAESIKLERESKQALASDIVHNAERKSDAQRMRVDREAKQSKAAELQSESATEASVSSDMATAGLERVAMVTAETINEENSASVNSTNQASTVDRSSISTATRRVWVVSKPVTSLTTETLPSATTDMANDSSESKTDQTIDSDPGSESERSDVEAGDITESDPKYAPSFKVTVVPTGTVQSRPRNPLGLRITGPRPWPRTIENEQQFTSYSPAGQPQNPNFVSSLRSTEDVNNGQSWPRTFPQASDEQVIKRSGDLVDQNTQIQKPVSESPATYSQQQIQQPQSASLRSPWPQRSPNPPRQLSNNLVSQPTRVVSGRKPWPPVGPQGQPSSQTAPSSNAAVSGRRPWPPTASSQQSLVQQTPSEQTLPQPVVGMTSGRRAWPPTNPNQNSSAQVPSSDASVSQRRPWPSTFGSTRSATQASPPTYQQTPLTVTGRRPWPPTSGTQQATIQSQQSSESVNMYESSQVQSSVEMAQTIHATVGETTDSERPPTSTPNDQIQEPQQPSFPQQYSFPPQQRFIVPDTQLPSQQSAPRRRAASRPSNIGPPPPPSRGVRPRWN